MAITKTQLANRSKHLGSTDIVALAGLHPKLNKYDIWLSKTGKLTEDEAAQEKWVSRGNYMEPALIMFATEMLGPIKTTKQEFPAANGLIVSHPDGTPTKIPSATLEAKSVGPWAEEKMLGDNGIVLMPAKDCWGESNTDVVPHRVSFQCQVHILCTGAEVCYVPAYLPYREFEMFVVPRDMKIIGVILDMAHDFWDNNVIKDKPPENLLPNLETIKRVKHTPDKVVTVSPGTAQMWIDARKQRLEAEKQEAIAETALRAALGDAEAGQFDGGLITLYESIRRGYKIPNDVKAKYVYEQHIRTLRLKEK